jgi:hypothetical protein
VAKISGNSGKKWQEIEGFHSKSWKNEETSGRNFKFQRDHRLTNQNTRKLTKHVFVGFFVGAPCMADNLVVKVHYGGM